MARSGPTRSWSPTTVDVSSTGRRNALATTLRCWWSRVFAVGREIAVELTRRLHLAGVRVVDDLGPDTLAAPVETAMQ